MATVELRQTSRIYDPAQPPAVSRVTLDIADGEFLVLVGPSGCGKSTTLRMLAGLEPVDEGQVLIDGVDVTRSRARDRDVAMVFQSYALYPNMTARQNMAFALQNAKVDKPTIEQRVSFAAEMLELEDLLEKKPSQMSGGQRQRVAMGRAIVREPKVFLMDEPLSNLDARLRVSTRSQILELQRRLGTTTVYVTHDQTEAMTMGDRVCVLKDGILQQVDTPRTLYDNPGNTFVAGFIGSPSITLIDSVAVAGSHARLGAGGSVELEIPVDVASKIRGDQLIVGVRPENFEVCAINSEAPSDALELNVKAVEHLGSDLYAYCVPSENLDAVAGLSVRGGKICVKATRDTNLEMGDRISVRVRPSGALFFDAETEINYNYL